MRLLRDCNAHFHSPLHWLEKSFLQLPFICTSQLCLEFERLAFLRERISKKALSRVTSLPECKACFVKLVLLFLSGEVVMELEDFFCSKVRIKILKLLLKLGQLTPSVMAKRVGTNYASTRKHLELLEKENMVEQRLSGRTRYFRFANSVKAQATKKLLEEWET